MTHQPHLTYIGHATTLIELAGVRLLTDPAGGDCGAGVEGEGGGRGGEIEDYGAASG